MLPYITITTETVDVGDDIKNIAIAHVVGPAPHHAVLCSCLPGILHTPENDLVMARLSNLRQQHICAESAALIARDIEALRRWQKTLNTDEADLASGLQFIKVWKTTVEDSDQ